MGSVVCVSGGCFASHIQLVMDIDTCSTHIVLTHVRELHVHMYVPLGPNLKEKSINEHLHGTTTCRQRSKNRIILIEFCYTSHERDVKCWWRVAGLYLNVGNILTNISYHDMLARVLDLRLVSIFALIHLVCLHI